MANRLTHSARKSISYVYIGTDVSSADDLLSELPPGSRVQFISSFMQLWQALNDVNVQGAKQISLFLNAEPGRLMIDNEVLDRQRLVSLPVLGLGPIPVKCYSPSLGLSSEGLAFVRELRKKLHGTTQHSRPIDSLNAFSNEEHQ